MLTSVGSGYETKGGGGGGVQRGEAHALGVANKLNT